MSEISKNVREIREKIREAALGAGRDPDSVRLLAVTKTVSPETIKEAFEAGQTLFGENYVQEALPKIDAIPRAEWHMIGHLQSNKAKYVVGTFSMVHTVDRPSLAAELSRLCIARGIKLPVLLQANLSGEASKGGADAEGIIAIAKRALEWPGIEIQGLMAIPPYEEDPEMSRPHFRALRLLANRIDSVGFSGVKMYHLSMGMSHDFKAAIEEGATIVRVGSALFGQRL
ncbi:YggS family pyridoxal phosphate-dependent enzyme [bacterium]|nr:MAG: YggS family pyridoxal phosphate-dependent enzyme [bacterium]